MDLRDREASLAEQFAEQVGRARKHARPWKSIFALALGLVAAGVSAAARDKAPHADHHTPWLLISYLTAAAFALLGGSSVLGLSAQVRQMLLVRMGASHASMVRVLLVIIGWAALLTITLDLCGVPVERLILGGALTGVILGIAAQQTLANLFAGVVLLLSKPFEVGDEIKVSSGAMGGSYEGTVIEVGLTYTRMEAEAGVLHLPNAQVLAAAVTPVTPVPKDEEEPSETPVDEPPTPGDPGGGILGPRP